MCNENVNTECREVGLTTVDSLVWFKHILFQKKRDYQQAQSLRVAFQKKNKQYNKNILKTFIRIHSLPCLFVLEFFYLFSYLHFNL